MEKITKQDKNTHRAYMKAWREKKKIKDAQRLESETDEFADCRKFRFMIQNLMKREEAFMEKHFNECSNCRFWFREIQHRNDKKADIEDPFNWHYWQTPEPQKEEKLDPLNQLLRDELKDDFDIK